MNTRVEIIEPLPPLQAREIADVSDLHQLADWLDTRFVIPGTTIRFGLDSLLGLIPGIGDGISALIGLHIMNRARDLGAPPLLLARMGGNIALDAVLGAIPLVGDIFDVAFKSNRKNVNLLLRHLEKQGHHLVR